MCFLLGEFSFLNAIAKVNFPKVTTPYHTSSVTQTSYDSFAVQGELESGTMATFKMFSTPSGVNSLTWIITGEKGSLKFEAPAVNFQTDPAKLFLYLDTKGENLGAGTDIYQSLDVDLEGMWEPVEVAQPIAYGQVGEVYEAIANGEKVKGCLVDFEGGALRHRMLEACFRSVRNGTRETYRK